MDILDEKGWVFLDNGQPWHVRMWGGKPWLFRWHPNRMWVSHGIVTQERLWTFPHNLSDDQQEIYHKIHQEKMDEISPE